MANNGDVLNDGTLKWRVRKPSNLTELGYRDSSVEYTLGQIAYHSSLPTGWFLECTTAGTTSNNNLTIENVDMGDTLTDGTVTWTIRSLVKIVSFDKTNGNLDLAPVYLLPEAEIDYDSLPYLSFIEENGDSFTLKVYSENSSGWDGTLEYSTNTENWLTWDGTEISSSNDGKLYLRGTGNSRITYVTGIDNYHFVLTSGKRIQCLGNIENLLDYTTVLAGSHPTMSTNCYQYMFKGCTSLTAAPQLPAPSFSANLVYAEMFQDCTSLTSAPSLPATTLTLSCYTGMFAGCTSLESVPQLPATVLANRCYQNMFNGCTSLTISPELPAMTLKMYCYSSMFSGCTSLAIPPSTLPATTLATNCYNGMFNGCTNLTGTIHCPASISENSNRLDSNTNNLPENTATVVYDL